VRGWVNYFRIGNARRCLAYVRVWVEQRVRRHLMRARGRRGFGWKRWSTAWLHDRLGLFGDYRGPILGRARKRSWSIGHINHDTKQTGERRTRNPFAPFDEAGAGNGLRWAPRQSSTLRTIRRVLQL
jgi:Group II intron, maturase-specific domain